MAVCVFFFGGGGTLRQHTNKRATYHTRPLRVLLRAGGRRPLPLPAPHRQAPHRTGKLSSKEFVCLVIPDRSVPRSVVSFQRSSVPFYQHPPTQKKIRSATSSPACAPRARPRSGTPSSTTSKGRTRPPPSACPGLRRPARCSTPGNEEGCRCGVLV